MLKYLFNVFVTWCLGLLLLIPFLNVYILNEVIYQESGVDTKYYKNIYSPYYPSYSQRNKKDAKQKHGE